MKYLIVMPRFVDTIGEWYHFPLGIPYISACLKKENLEVFTINLNSLEGKVETLLKKIIFNNDIDVVLTGGLSFQYNAIKEIIDAVKNIKKDIITIVGGGIITSAPIPAMEALVNADYGIVGEGEITTVELCILLKEKISTEKTDGIVYKNNSDYKMNNKRAEICDLDLVPFPDYEGFDFDKIVNAKASLLGMNETNTITMSTSRSCPFQCTFCFHTSGSKYRQRSLDNFFAELDLLVEKYKIKYVFISDELFAHNKKRVKEFCTRIKPYGIKWWAQFRVNDISEDLVNELKDANCATMGFGIESADNEILKSMNKKITIEETEKALEIVYKAGITIQGGFIFGDVIETIDTARKTINWWTEHIKYGLSLNFITTYPGTPLYDYAIKNKIIIDEVQFIKDGCPVVNLTKMTKDEISWLNEQVVSLPQLLLKEPLDINSEYINFQESTISFKGKCSVCNGINNWENVRIFTRNILSCNHCGQKHKVPISQSIKNNFYTNLVRIINKYKKVAFWGMNDYFVNFYEIKDTEINNKIIFIDNSKIKQNNIIHNKVISAPEIINKEEIEFVIVPVLSVFTTIEKQIKSNYPSVKKTISILELFKNTL